MTRLTGTLAALILLGAFHHSAAQETLSSGQRLAREMRRAQLLNYEKISGSLRTRGRRGKRSSQDIVLSTHTREEQWRSIFSVTDPNTGNLTRLTIVRGPKQPPRYFLTQNPKDVNDPATALEVASEEAMVPLAGTDFWLADLGLEFFYWPEQTILTNARIKMRKGISCFVLESRREPATHAGYSRIRSWISRKHGGLIYAEAYDSNGKRIKTFEVSDVEKINGEWKLKELRIRDETAKSTTRLSFDNE
ncbi:MAG: hypothetical protein M2R45_02765 [Verrucomicrobia subdivision 3 bacterium]|nr:hypothetical protein [Limisphaerales bacterium]MCS1414314.1 hypothetical protein [Limisphaerales bacterium]